MKRRMMALLLAGVMGVGMMSGCGSSKSADSGKVVREESDEPIDVLNQDEKMKLSIVCLQGYTQPDSEMQKWMEAATTWISISSHCRAGRMQHPKFPF